MSLNLSDVHEEQCHPFVSIDDGCSVKQNNALKECFNAISSTDISCPSSNSINISDSLHFIKNEKDFSHFDSNTGFDRRIYSTSNNFSPRLLPRHRRYRSHSEVSSNLNLSITFLQRLSISEPTSLGSLKTKMNRCNHQNSNTCVVMMMESSGEGVAFQETFSRQEFANNRLFSCVIQLAVVAFFLLFVALALVLYSLPPHSQRFHKNEGFKDYHQSEEIVLNYFSNITSKFKAPATDFQLRIHKSVHLKSYELY